MLNQIKKSIGSYYGEASEIVDGYLEDFALSKNEADQLIMSAREKIYGTKPEVSQTLVGTPALVQPELKIEIKCIAYLNNG